MTRQVKVGLFVILGLVLTMAAVFVIGDTRRLWEAKSAYRAAFQDVAGLKPGAPVRMGGLDIGAVTAVDHESNPADPRIFVSMSISKRESVRIRAETIARVVNKGLLGDKMVELTVAPPTSAPLDAHQLISSEEPQDMFAAANRMAAAAEKAIAGLEPLARTLGDPKLSEDIKGSAADLHSLLNVMVHGDGTMHRLFYDREEADELGQLVARMNGAAWRLQGALADVQDVTSHVREGPGIAHAIVYDGELSKSAAGAVGELHQDLRALREGNGLGHALLYGDGPSQHTLANLYAMSDDLRAIVGDLRRGKGTIGALLVDPTVYEDLKAAIGNVERNQVLRALVRYSIKADEQRPPPRVEGRP